MIRPIAPDGQLRVSASATRDLAFVCPGTPVEGDTAVAVVDASILQRNLSVILALVNGNLTGSSFAERAVTGAFLSELDVQFEPPLGGDRADCVYHNHDGVNSSLLGSGAINKALLTRDGAYTTPPKDFGGFLSGTYYWRSLVHFGVVPARSLTWNSSTPFKTSLQTELAASLELAVEVPVAFDTHKYGSSTLPMTMSCSGSATRMFVSEFWPEATALGQEGPIAGQIRFMSLLGAQEFGDLATWNADNSWKGDFFDGVNSVYPPMVVDEDDAQTPAPCPFRFVQFEHVTPTNPPGPTELPEGCFLLWSVV
jgi:hypothetical protein